MGGVTPDDLGLLTLTEAADRVRVAPATLRKWKQRYGLKTYVDPHDGRTYVVELSLLQCDRDRRRALATRGGQRRLAS